jgi:hypothetical protein
MSSAVRWSKYPTCSNVGFLANFHRDGVSLVQIEDFPHRASCECREVCTFGTSGAEALRRRSGSTI